MKLPVLFAAALFVAATAHAEPVKVIFDTDMANDCDDAGALAVLHALADLGEAEILAVITNRKDPSNASAAAVDAINTWYGRGEIPIGTDKDGATGAAKRGRPSEYCAALRDGFPQDAKPDDAMPDALDVYRETLSRQEDGSVVICSVMSSVALIVSATLSAVKPNWVRMKAGVLFRITARRSEYSASFAVTGLPEWNFTPGRM